MPVSTLLAVLLLATGSADASEAGLLDGTRWTLSLGGIAGWLTRDDVLEYDAGLLSSASCVPKGFAAQPYQSSADGEGIEWTAVQTNAAGDTVSWKGRREGKGGGASMTGTVTWTKKGGAAKTFSWSAKAASSPRPDPP